ncbi:type II toxin-antitoxin system RelE/ParE family toxin [Desulfoluna butyratoxydans]|uniref:Toxin higb-like n=1 Tax=Desulfoluna butyratoxydans TaxID=231438 RepID=A0A4U8YUX7_9BACT|nr:type II toxin-antitoxin system RelE/ParE family toxin [Desulfoluna butyratoxydans]VFQ47387.1 toxin higb-like [Desulfoluna butyratoxydans]
MKWTVTFYSDKVRDEIFQLPPKVQAKLIHQMEMVESYGPMLGLPHVRQMGDGLYEIRAKALDGNARSFFCAMKGQELIILHTFLKKAQKTPNKELKLARRRLREVKS